MSRARLIVVLVCIGAVTFLTFAGKLDRTVFVAVVGPIIGYVVAKE